MRAIRRETLTIAIDTTTSNGLEITDSVFGMLQFPAAFTGTVVTPQIKAHPNADWADVYDDAGDTITIPVVDGKATRIPDECFPCCNLRIVSGSSEAAARTVYFIGST
jgi:hypothetical protein